MGNTDGRVYSFAATHRPACVGDRHERVRLLLAGRHRHPGPRPDRLPRLLRRDVLRVQRAVGSDPLDAPGGQPDLRLADDHRRRRLLLRTRIEVDRGPRRPHRPSGVLVSRRRLQPGDRRRPRDLPRRLFADLPDAAATLGAPSRERAQGELSQRANRAKAARSQRKNHRKQHAKRNMRSGWLAILIRSMRCRSGSHCQQPAIKGRRFCEDHAAELDRMREELKDAAAARIGRGRPKRSSTCCRPGCYEPRVPPAAYCDACAAAGYVEEAA